MIRLGYTTIRSLLFKLDPEISHTFAIRALTLFQKLPVLARPVLCYHSVATSRLQQTILNLRFQNPVGLAAGFDKDAESICGLSTLGFGFVETGTVTVRPQKGNPLPRLFRHPKYESLQNSMGFNNKGKLAMLDSLTKRHPFQIPVGINIGKNKNTPLEKSLDDYVDLLGSLQRVCDYFVINLSSPNTPGLRTLANNQFVEKIFTVSTEISEKPVFLKVSPDQELAAILDLAQTAVGAGADGIIATNTTTDYSLIPGVRPVGGLSGKVLREKSFHVLNALAKKLFGKTILISVGGIDSGLEAYQRIKEGASLVQIYSGLIYKGPGLVRKINKEILELLDKDGFNNITEAVGANQKG